LVGGVACTPDHCTCAHGSPTSGDNCPGDGAHVCDSCDTGYHKEGDFCLPDVCVCENGAPAKGDACPGHGAKICAACQSGFHKEGDFCNPDVCTCKDGSPTSGADCPGHGAEVCKACNTGFHLEGDTCQIDVCSCSNGSPAQGAAACPGHGAEICAACHIGFHMVDGSACYPNACLCRNGTAPAGLACPGHGATLCAACYTGYALIAHTCLPVRHVFLPPGHSEESMPDSEAEAMLQGRLSGAVQGLLGRWRSAPSPLTLLGDRPLVAWAAAVAFTSSVALVCSGTISRRSLLAGRRPAAGDLAVQGSEEASSAAQGLLIATDN